MKRAQALIGLSREHHEALVLARRASNADPVSSDASQLRQNLLQRWTDQFEPHFALEEARLFPALDAAGHRQPADEARSQHAQLRKLFQTVSSGDLLALGPWGDAMREHVRFEERVLFPLAETALDLTTSLEEAIPSAAGLSSSN